MTDHEAWERLGSTIQQPRPPWQCYSPDTRLYHCLSQCRASLNNTSYECAAAHAIATCACTAAPSAEAMLFHSKALTALRGLTQDSVHSPCMLESMNPRLTTREGATQALCRGEAPLDTRYAPSATVTTCNPQMLLLMLVVPQPRGMYNMLACSRRHASTYLRHSAYLDQGL